MATWLRGPVTRKVKVTGDPQTRRRMSVSRSRQRHARPDWIRAHSIAATASASWTRFERIAPGLESGKGLGEIFFEGVQVVTAVSPMRGVATLVDLIRICAGLALPAGGFMLFFILEELNASHI